MRAIQKASKKIISVNQSQAMHKKIKKNLNECFPWFIVQVLFPHIDDWCVIVTLIIGKVTDSTKDA